MLVYLKARKSENAHYSECALETGDWMSAAVPLVYTQTYAQRKLSLSLLSVRYNNSVYVRFGKVYKFVSVFEEAFEAVLAQIFYCRVGYSKSSHIAKITQLAIIFLSCKSVLPDALSDLDKQGRGKFSTAYRATTTQLLLNRLPIQHGRVDSQHKKVLPLTTEASKAQIGVSVLTE